MKLITEFNEHQEVVCIVEAKDNGEKSYAIEGVFAQADKKNRNGRIYPKAIMEKAVGNMLQNKLARSVLSVS